MSDTQRPTPTQAFRDLAMAYATRTASAPESSIVIGTTAKRIHTWEITVRGEDIDECARIARRLDDELAAKYASELDSDTLAGELARSVAK